MKVLIKEQISNLSSDDIQWYLSDEKLWITTYKEYLDIERNIKNSVGSFNWLYEVNDTVLFNKNDKRLETVIIDLSGKIITSDFENSIIDFQNEKKGEIFFAEDKNCILEFPSPVKYIKNFDCLIAFPEKLKKKKVSVTFAADDFGFIIFNNQLEGWVLKNASYYIYPLQGMRNNFNDASNILYNYFSALNLWEENENNIIELTNLLEVVKVRNDSVSLAVKECIDNILQYSPKC